MAVDTATKRYSMINFSTGDQQFPVPVNGVAADDRAHLLALYSGISLTVAASTPGSRMMMMGMGG